MWPEKKKLCIICGKPFQPILKSTISCGCDGRKRQSRDNFADYYRPDDRLRRLAAESIAVLDAIKSTPKGQSEMRSVADWVEDVLIPALSKQRDVCMRIQEGKPVELETLLTKWY